MDWIAHTQVDWNDNNVTAYSVDTRDFHIIANTQPIEKYPDVAKCSKHPERYYHTIEEIKALIDRYYEESGGEQDWRMFSLIGDGTIRTQNWQLKYIRIMKMNKGWIVYSGHTSDNTTFVFSKEMLASPVNKRYL